MIIDRRIKKTRDALSDALLSLLPTTPLNKITIKSIVDIANVSRSTFTSILMTYSIYTTKPSMSY